MSATIVGVDGRVFIEFSGPRSPIPLREGWLIETSSGEVFIPAHENDVEVYRERSTDGTFRLIRRDLTVYEYPLSLVDVTRIHRDGDSWEMERLRP